MKFLQICHTLIQIIRKVSINLIGKYSQVSSKMEQYTGWQKQVHTLKAKTDTYIVARKNTVGVQELANLQKGQDHQSLGQRGQNSEQGAVHQSRQSQDFNFVCVCFFLRAP